MGFDYFWHYDDDAFVKIRRFFKRLFAGDFLDIVQKQLKGHGILDRAYKLNDIEAAERVLSDSDYGKKIRIRAAKILGGMNDHSKTSKILGRFIGDPIVGEMAAEGIAQIARNRARVEAEKAREQAEKAREQAEKAREQAEEEKTRKREELLRKETKERWARLDWHEVVYSTELQPRKCGRCGREWKVDRYCPLCEIGLCERCSIGTGEFEVDQNKSDYDEPCMEFRKCPVCQGFTMLTPAGEPAPRFRWS